MANNKQSIDFFCQKGDPLVNRPVSRRPSSSNKKVLSIPVSRSSSQPVFGRQKSAVSVSLPENNTPKRTPIRRAIIPKKPAPTPTQKPSQKPVQKPTPKPEPTEPKSPFLESVQVEKRPLGESVAEHSPVVTTPKTFKSFDDPENDPRRKRKADPIRNERERTQKRPLPTGFIILLTAVIGIITGVVVYALISR